MVGKIIIRACRLERRRRRKTIHSQPGAAFCMKIALNNKLSITNYYTAGTFVINIIVPLVDMFRYSINTFPSTRKKKGRVNDDFFFVCDENSICNIRRINSLKYLLNQESETTDTTPYLKLLREVRPPIVCLSQQTSPISWELVHRNGSIFRSKRFQYRSVQEFVLFLRNWQITIASNEWRGIQQANTCTVN